MSLKYMGDKISFIEKLNNHFNTTQKGEQIGNTFRYIIYRLKNININLYNNGTVQIQPYEDSIEKEISNILNTNTNIIKNNKNKIFIVHGHDRDSKNALENMLYKWDLKPYAIQDEDSKGKTIIEFLESEIKNHSLGIVLLTPDDMGYSKKEGESNLKPRARQNVILELGMLIGAIGRENCIILRKAEVEIPSDIDGLIYIPFSESVEEIKDKLKQKLKSLGCFK